MIILKRIVIKVLSTLLHFHPTCFDVLAFESLLDTPSKMRSPSSLAGKQSLAPGQPFEDSSGLPFMPPRHAWRDALTRLWHLWWANGPLHPVRLPSVRTQLLMLTAHVRDSIFGYRAYQPEPFAVCTSCEATSPYWTKTYTQSLTLL